MITSLKLLNALRIRLQTFFRRNTQAVKWRQNNSHNYTTISVNVKNPTIIKVGKETYGEINVESYENPDEKLVIGNFVSIAPKVTFILGGNHQIHSFTTFPLKAYYVEKHSSDDAQTKGAVIVEDEVWIGNNVIIMSGVTIGQGAVIAAGSVVTKDVSAFSIVGGSPAKFIKWRIPEHLMEARKQINLVDLDLDSIKQNIDLFYSPLNEENLQKIINLKK